MMTDKERRAMWRRIFALESRMQDVEAATGDSEVPGDMPMAEAAPGVEKALGDLREALGYRRNYAGGFKPLVAAHIAEDLIKQGWTTRLFDKKWEGK